MYAELLQEARGLLEKAEKTFDLNEKNMFCQRAIDIFQEVEDSASDQDLQMVTNLRKAFARAQLNNIEDMSLKEIETTKFFFNHVFGFPKEIHELIAEKPEFRTRFKRLATCFNKNLDTL